MKAPFSKYLRQIAPGLKELTKSLRRHYDYVSVLATDNNGIAIRISQRAKQVADGPVCDRGCVVRVYKDGLYSEYSFNDFDPRHPEESEKRLLAQIDRQRELLKRLRVKVYDTPKLEDRPAELLAEKEAGVLPAETPVAELVGELTRISDEGMGKGKDMVDCILNAQTTQVSKLFLTSQRDLRQSYVYSEGAVVALCARDGKTELSYNAISGLKGPELFRGLGALAEGTVKAAEELLDAEEVAPGEYDVITSPEVSGLIAHEAFGHGVEMDMFVKERALGREYIGKRVGSDLVTMHEGALCALDCTSYAFDDEGTLAGDVTEIDKGILKTGICDALSALRLGTAPTGNGKRENFEHKAYTRMTNTLFDPGTDTLEDMIKSIKKGYLLEGMQSGMEDPKHWGIQCIIERGYEIADGKLTGKVVAPVVLTGYVPDLLGSISMASGKQEVFGSGWCGKGHKEWVKVADGGPYLKARVRLG